MARNIYTDAIDVQNACNLSGVVRSWVEAMDAIRADNSKLGTAEFSAHPVNVLFADKVYSLTGYGQRFSEAYKAAQDKATAPLPVCEVPANPVA